MKILKSLSLFFVFLFCLSCVNKLNLNESSLQTIIKSKSDYDIVSFAKYFNIDQSELKKENDAYLIGKEKMEGKNDIEIRKFPKDKSSYFLFYFKGDNKYFYKYDVIEIDNSDNKDWETPVVPK